MYSPLLSMLTAVFEIALAMMAFKSKGRKEIRYTSIVLLFLLASYQILETIICSGLQNIRFLFSFVFMIIIWLPPTGILLIFFLWPTGKKFLLGYVFLLFVLSLFMVIWIIFSRDFVVATSCFWFFARFSNRKIIYLFYSILYELGLLSMIFLSAYGVINSTDFKQRKLLGQILLGSISFVVFSLLTVIAIPMTKGALPSIMCHYALLLAVFIGRLLYLENKFS